MKRYALVNNDNKVIGARLNKEFTEKEIEQFEEEYDCELEQFEKEL